MNKKIAGGYKGVLSDPNFLGMKTQKINFIIQRQQ